VLRRRNESDTLPAWRATEIDPVSALLEK